MKRRDQSLDARLAVLTRRHSRAGPDVYARAVEAARVAVAKVVLAEAERLAGAGRPRPTGKVVSFPTGREYLPRGSRRRAPEYQNIDSDD